MFNDGRIKIFSWDLDLSKLHAKIVRGPHAAAFVTKAALSASETNNGAVASFMSLAAPNSNFSKLIGELSSLDNCLIKTESIAEFVRWLERVRANMSFGKLNEKCGHLFVIVEVDERLMGTSRVVTLLWDDLYRIVSVGRPLGVHVIIVDEHDLLPEKVGYGVRNDDALEATVANCDRTASNWLNYAPKTRREIETMTREFGSQEVKRILRERKDDKPYAKFNLVDVPTGERQAVSFKLPRLTAALIADLAEKSGQTQTDVVVNAIGMAAHDSEQSYVVRVMVNDQPLDAPFSFRASDPAEALGEAREFLRVRYGSSS